MRKFKELKDSFTKSLMKDGTLYGARTVMADNGNVVTIMSIEYTNRIVFTVWAINGKVVQVTGHGRR